MKEPAFDIFSGESDKDAVWIDSVQGLSKARERLEQIAAKKPGRYFIFSTSSSSILVRIETFNKPEAASSYAAASASDGEGYLKKGTSLHSGKMSNLDHQSQQEDQG